jgi:hypothetical protein
MAMNHGDEYVAERAAATAAALSMASFINHAHQLRDEHRYLDIHYLPTGTFVSITPRGARWLEEHDAVPD